MKLIWAILGVLVALLLLLLLGAYICYRMAFFSPKRKPLGEDEVDLPEGKVYEPFHEDMIRWAKTTRAMPHEDMTVTAFD